MRTLPLLCACLCLFACSSDPASEAPVELRTGMYQVNIGGGTIVDLSHGRQSGEICLDPSQTSELPGDPLQVLTGSWSDCLAQIEPRKGNAIGGTRTCDERR